MPLIFKEAYIGFGIAVDEYFVFCALYCHFLKLNILMKKIAREASEKTEGKYHLGINNHRSPIVLSHYIIVYQAFLCISSISINYTRQ